MYRVILAALGVAMLTVLQILGAPSAKANGLASFYGYDFAGRLTANGERFNPQAMTAASKTLPFGTLVRVTNRHNGRSVVVRINDRGPYVGGRVIDLSLGAASVVGMLGSGVAAVDIAIIGSGSRTLVAANSPRHRATSVQVAARVKHRHATVQVASLGRHKHHGRAIQIASVKHKHQTTLVAHTPASAVEGAPSN